MRWLIAVAFLSACAGPAPRASTPKPWGFAGQDFVVAADHPAASEAGVRMLAAGGNAVDAAAATSLALSVVRPQSAGLGGGGFMLLTLAGKKPVFVDYRETAPGAAEPAAYLGADGRPVPGKTEAGPWAVGVPGQLRGIPVLLAKLGTKTLAEALVPAIELAEKGFPVDKVLHAAMLDMAGRIAAAAEPRRYDEISRIFLKDGRPYAAGEVLFQPDLAAALRRLASEGAEKFYLGAFSDAVLKVAGAEAGGPMTREDLDGYALSERRPLSGTYRGRTVLSAPPPSSGGACVLQILGTMEGFSPKRLRRPEGTALLVESMKHAFADRARLLGDPDVHPEVEENAAAMLAPRHIRELRRKVGVGRTAAPETYGVQSLPDDGGTTHYSILDAQGNAIAATETINLYFGSLLVAPGLGIVLNNQMDDFAISTTAANAFGLRQSELNLVGPGRKPLSSMSPTIILERGSPTAALGGSGGPLIITGTVQSILNAVDGGMAPDEAVAAPRVHHQWSPDVVRFDAEVPAETRALLLKRGHRLEPFAGESAVQMVTRQGGELRGGSDPRKGGRPDGR
ncbi:MAG: gamma-glutamyltransferase [Elusimicrobia bacterium]|nr:gamma-glutamyltransferase [Elusimicrobiota bacterium]